MGGVSKLWLVSAGLLAGAAGLAGVAATSYWRSCGQFLTGTMPNEYSLRAGFTEACLAAMQQAPGSFVLPGGPQTGWGVLALVAAFLLPLAWLVLLPTTRLSPLTRLVVALPAVLGLGFVGVVLATQSRPEMLGQLSLWIEISAMLAILVLANAREAAVSGWLLVRYAIVLLAASPAGILHLVADYYATLAFTGATWDEPPGTGFFTVLAVALAAVATLVLWLRDKREPAALGTAPGAGPRARLGGLAILGR